MDTSKKTNLGYRLHKNRVLFSGGEIIRTIKYPILPYDNNNSQQQQFYENFKKAIIKDDLTIRGDLNLNDYLTYTYSNQPIYSLFDYWVDSLKAGVIWVSKASEFSEIIPLLYPDAISIVDKIWNNASKELKEIFDKESFSREFILKGEIRKSKTKNSLKNTLKDCFKKNIEKDCPQAEKLINDILKSFFGESNELILQGKKNQDEFWIKKFNLDKSAIGETKPQGKVGKITFFIIPELINLDNELKIEELISKRENWLKEKIGEEKVDNLLKIILGLENNFNGLCNYFNIALKAFQKDQVNIIFDTLLTVNESIVKEHETKIKNSLRFLSEKALKLGKPSLPMVSSWAEYRSVFGGKLESWFSNMTKRKKELSQQIKNFQESLGRAEKFIDEKTKNTSSQKITQSEVDTLKLLLSRLKQFDNEKKIERETEYEVFSSLLSSFKKQLNFFYQAFNDKKNEEENVTNDEQLKGIFEKIHKPVAFFGFSSKKRSKKIIEKTIPIIKEGIDFIFKLLPILARSFNPETTFNQFKRKDDTEETNYRKFLNFFLIKIQDSAINSTEFKKKYADIIKNELKDESLLQTLVEGKNKRYVFYKSPYSKGTVSQIKINEKNWLEAYRQLVLDLKDFILQFDKQRLLTDKMLLIDWIELSKTVFSSFNRFNERKTFSLKDFSFENFETAKNYVNLFGLNDLNKEEFSFFVQSLILSELKGAATLFSKKNYIAKYTVQAIKSNEKFLLFYQPKDNGINLKEIDLKKNNKSLMKPHQYLVLLQKNKENKNKDANLLKLDKSRISKVYLDISNLNSLFRLSSSPYQLQFLDKFVYRPKGWEEIDINLAEWSFIVEQEYEINWLIDEEKPQFILKTNSKKNKLYLSIPFQIKAIAKDKDKNFQLKNVVEKRVDYPILGVDVGEYGLAYCLVSFAGEKINVLKTGFIKDNNIANIKDKFSLIQQKSRQGIFNEKDSSVSRVRENAIGHLRNQLHVVLTDDKGASVVYENQISNFETGSNKTTKIYDSVKRADVKVETDADKQIHNHIWGKNTMLIGKHLSAYASSYTCAKCHRSLYQVEKDDLEGATINPNEGNILIIKTMRGSFYGYSQNEKYKKIDNIVLKNTKESLNEFRKLVQDFARPPVSEKSEVLKKFYPSLFKDKESFEKFRKQRGNSAIFICPFVDCNYLADADIQAAFMMALRGYLNFKEIVKSKEKKENYQGKDKKDSQSEHHSTGQSYLEESIQLLNIANFNPDNLFYPLADQK